MAQRRLAGKCSPPCRNSKPFRKVLTILFTNSSLQIVYYPGQCDFANGPAVCLSTGSLYRNETAANSWAQKNSGKADCDPSGLFHPLVMSFRFLTFRRYGQWLWKLPILRSATNSFGIKENFGWKMRFIRGGCLIFRQLLHFNRCLRAPDSLPLFPYCSKSKRLPESKRRSCRHGTRIAKSSVSSAPCAVGFLV